MLPQLIAWVWYGAVLGLAAEALSRITASWPGPDSILPKGAERYRHRRIVILGGGFAGMATAERLERVFGANHKVTFTLVSDTNALLFTPMLAEVAGSSLEPTHISSPLRTGLRRTQVVRGHVVGIDLEKHMRLPRNERTLAWALHSKRTHSGTPLRSSCLSSWFCHELSERDAARQGVSA
jgi:NADH dehydrogenase